MKLAEIIFYTILLSIPAAVLIYWFYLGFTKAGKERLKRMRDEQRRQRREFYERHKKYSCPDREYFEWEDYEKYVDKDLYKHRRNSDESTVGWYGGYGSDCGDGSDCGGFGI